MSELLIFLLIRELFKLGALLDPVTLITPILGFGSIREAVLFCVPSSREKLIEDVFANSIGCVVFYWFPCKSY